MIPAGGRPLPPEDAPSPLVRARHHALLAGQALAADVHTPSRAAIDDALAHLQLVDELLAGATRPANTITPEN